MSQLFTLGGQIIGVSASTSILPMNTQDWSPLGWTGWISLQSPKFSGTPSSEPFLPSWSGQEGRLPYSSGSSWPRNQTGVSCIAGGLFTNWTIREASMMMVSTAMSPTGTMLFWTQHSSEETIARTNETLQTIQTILQLTCLQTF